MAYNPYDAVNAIYNFKKQWHTADAQGDKKTADDVAKKAQEYYKQLNDNGYSDLANNLSNTNDVGAKAYRKNYNKHTCYYPYPHIHTGQDR